MKNLFKKIYKLLLFFIKIICAWLFVNLILFLYCFEIEPNSLVTKENRLISSKTNELSIIHFTDLHLSPWTKEEYISKLVKNINNQKAEYVVFTGDIFEDYKNTKHNMDLDFFKNSLLNINAKYQKIAIIGNHDCISSMTLDEYTKFMEECGFIVLNNNNYYDEKNNICFYGINTNNNKNSWNIKDINPSTYNILLLHAPDYINDINISNIDLALSGHTHGGQINIPYLNKTILPKGGKIYTKGKYEVENTTLYVSSGIGMSRLPMRFLVKPEIIIHKIN